MAETAPETPAAKDLSLKAQQEALRDGRIVGFVCAACDHRQLTPLARCPNGHRDVKTRQFSSEGVVETYTIQHVASESFMNEVPFAWAIIRLDDGGPRVSGWIPFTAEASDLPVGQRVRYTASYKPGMMFEKA